MLFVKQGGVRTLAGEIYVCRESSLAILEAAKISYEEVPLPPAIRYVKGSHELPMKNGPKLPKKKRRKGEPWFVQGGRPDSNRRRH